MPIPEPFTPLALSAGIITNIASSILQANAHRLRHSLVGKALQVAGLIDPDFEENIGTVLGEALRLYFEEFPTYTISGVEYFFKDQEVSKELISKLLDRKQIDNQVIQTALTDYLHLEDKVTAAVIKQRKLNPDSIVPNFLASFRIALTRTMNPAQVSLFVAILDLEEGIITNIRQSEERLREFVEIKLSVQLDYLVQINEGQQHFKSQMDQFETTIKEFLGIDRETDEIVEELRDSVEKITASRGSLFERGGLCNNYISLSPFPNRYFVAQEFSKGRDDLKDALSKALDEFGMTPINADDFFQGGPILCKIGSLIQNTPFGIYQLTHSKNRNIYLELGIALGLGRPFIMVKQHDAEVASLMAGVEYFQINSFLQLRYELAEQVRPFILDIAQHKPKELPGPGSSNSVVIAHGDTEEPDFTIAIARELTKLGLLPIVLSENLGDIKKYAEHENIQVHSISNTAYLLTNEAIKAIQAAKFGIYRIDEVASANSFLCAGISLGLGRPGILVSRKGENVPSNLQGIVRLEFASYNDLEKSIADHISRFSHSER
jgi:hypothetical protein